ncbi:hypothetical protein FACS189490_12990 [Clostridia bacterium]|nr:hypothetical protein FACS189490_12990 [Clostridia bacterium]
MSYTTPEAGYLGLWLKIQREKYREGNLSDEQIKKLEEVEIDWNGGWNPGEIWNERYAYLHAYYEQNGHSNITSTYITPEGFHLGDWLKMQRYKYRDGKLSDEQIRKLEEIDIKNVNLYSCYCATP